MLELNNRLDVIGFLIDTGHAGHTDRIYNKLETADTLGGGENDFRNNNRRNADGGAFSGSRQSAGKI
jgi:hypothetical protein